MSIRSAKQAILDKASKYTIPMQIITIPKDAVITEAVVLHYYHGNPNHEGPSYGHIELDLPAHLIGRKVKIIIYESEGE